jgi:hypothetical protein
MAVFIASLIIVTLGAAAILTLGGMALMMSIEAFGVLITCGYIALLGFWGLALYLVPAGAILLLCITALIVVAGLSIPMIIGAIIGKKGTITSWPPAQEQAFMTFEHRGSSSHTTAMMVGLAGAAFTLLFALGVKFGVTPDKRDIGKTMNMSNLTKKSKEAAPAPKPDAPKAETPKTDTPPAEAPPAEKK